MAIKQRKSKETPLIHHSERLQYCANDYQNTLNKTEYCQVWKIWENAVAERINGILKQEFMIDKYNLDLKSWNKLWKESVNIYNELRPHYSNYADSNKMHLQSQIKMRTYKTKTLAKMFFCKCLIKYYCLIICIGLFRTRQISYSFE
jgi:hypothetical protein